MAKSLLSVPINQIPTTSVSDDNDYIIIESTSQGTKIIKKKDFVPSLDAKFGAGLKIADDLVTVQVDFENVAGDGLSGSDTTQNINVLVGHGLEITDENKVAVDESVAFSESLSSSIYFYDAAGDRQILSHTLGNVYNNFWGKGGSLSSIQITPYTVPTIDSNSDPILYNLADASVPKQLIIVATAGGLSGLASPNDTAISYVGGSIGCNDNIARWNSTPLYNNVGSVTITGESTHTKVQTRIKLPVGSYIFDGGSYNIYNALDYGSAHLKMYDETGTFQYHVGASSGHISQWDKSYQFALSNAATGGVFSLTQEQVTAGWYMRLEFFAGATWTSFNGSSSDPNLFALTYGSLKFTKIG